MANSKINSLTTATIDIANDGIPFGDASDSGNAKKMTATALKTALSLNNVDNTSDANKPISTATQTALDAKEDTIAEGTTGQYWRGDKTWQTLNKSAVGLGNVDNTADLSKPISTATQTALDAKENSLGYTAENASNKSTDVSTDQASNTKYPSVKAVYDWATGLFATIANLALKSDKLIITNRQTASYTLVLSDADKLVEMNVAGANNLTVPPNSSVAFPIGTQIMIAQYGAGETTVVAGSGVTIRSSGGKLKLNVQYAGATLTKIATDEWYLFGEIKS